jgi:hypothetical protein
MEIHTFYFIIFLFLYAVPFLPCARLLGLSVGDLTRLAPLENGFPRISFSLCFYIPLL